MRRTPLSRRAMAAALALSLALPVALLAAAPATVGAAAPCVVRNAATGATSGNLRKAITNAKAGATLQVGGTCVGPFTVTRKLTLTARTPSATLKGGGKPTLTVAKGVTVKVVGLTITGGRATRCAEWTDFACGGGVSNAGRLTLDTVTVRGNAAEPAGGSSRHSAFGGGIYNAPMGVLTLVRSTVRGNRSTATKVDGYAQGAGIGNDGTMVIRTSTISGNTTDGTLSQGAGIYNEGYDTDLDHDAKGSLTIVNSTISGNSSGDATGEGGGLYSDLTATRLVLDGVTVTGNAAHTGGGLRLSGTATLSGTLVAANSDVVGYPDCFAESAPTADHVLLGVGEGCGLTDGSDGNQVGGAGTPLLPGIGPLAANGGPTRTHALQHQSPAIDAAGSCGLTQDQRGTARPQGGGCDIGAFEAS